MRAPKRAAVLAFLLIDMSTVSQDKHPQKPALRKNLTKCAFYAAFCKVMNSVLVKASRCALSNRYLMSR